MAKIFNPKTKAVHAALLAAKKYGPDAAGFFLVQLSDVVKPAGMSAVAFSGHLAALNNVNVIDDLDNEKAFVKP
jgi:hypothetical protein